MRIFDCIILADELDLLEARMHEMAGYDVTHVICEASAGHDGTPKPLHFWENRDRFPQGRWTSVRVEPGELSGNTPKERKESLRSYLMHGLSSAPGDIILHGGVDEIPNARVIQDLLQGNILAPVGMEMRHCVYRTGLVHPRPWRGTVAQYHGCFAGMTEFRDRKDILPAVLHAGTRLSLMGEIPGEIHPDGHALRKFSPDESYPRWIREGRNPQNWN